MPSASEDFLVVRISVDSLAPLLRLLTPPTVTGAPDAVSASLKTKRESAAHLGVSTSTVDRLVRQGMPHVVVGHTKRFDLESCRAWLAERGPRARKAEGETRAISDTLIARAATRSRSRAVLVGGVQPT